MSTAAVLAVAAVVVVVANNNRDVVLGFAIGGILTPMIANQLSRRKAVSSRPDRASSPRPAPGTET